MDAQDRQVCRSKVLGSVLTSVSNKGGGTNPQIIPESEGGDGQSSAFFEQAEGKEDLRDSLARQNPGGSTYLSVSVW